MFVRARPWGFVAFGSKFALLLLFWQTCCRIPRLLWFRYWTRGWLHIMIVWTCSHLSFIAIFPKPAWGLTRSYSLILRLVRHCAYLTCQFRMIKFTFFSLRAFLSKSANIMAEFALFILFELFTIVYESTKRSPIYVWIH